MPRSIVLGNGSVLAGIDSHGLLRDFYYEYVGLDNHMGEDSQNLIGVWVDGILRWINEPDWNTVVTYHEETLSGNITCINNAIGIELNISDVVYNEKNIYIRKITVINRDSNTRKIKLFLNTQFRMYGTPKKDTVYFDPSDNTIVHYKGRRVAVIGGQLDGENFVEYSVGLSHIEGKEGTYKDAEDGILSKNSIEHGTVDSTIGFEKELSMDSSYSVYYFISFAKTMDEAKALNEFVNKKTPEHLISTTQNYWRAWVNKNKINFYSLDKKIIDVFKTSLMVMRTHADNNGGIIASSDFDLLRYGRDNYTYVWPRDASFVAQAFNRAGYFTISKKFIEFASDTITSDGYFFHRYRCDKSWGSSWHPWIVDDERRLPIQEDETALVLITLWEYYEKTKDLEFVELIYNSLIKNSANFILGFRGENRLPFASYDLWEMKYDIHTFTSASSYKALIAASNFAQVLGKKKDENFYKKGAIEIKNAIISNLYDENLGYFKKSLNDDSLDVSSFYGVFKFGICEPDDQILKNTYNKVLENLVCKTQTSGAARFSNDEYYKSAENATGNPWIITTLWLAQYEIAISKNEKDLAIAKERLLWAVERALASGILPEQFDPNTGQPLSATPLIWSHAEFVTTVLDYLEKMKDLGIINEVFL